jgi:DNA processing protein
MLVGLLAARLADTLAAARRNPSAVLALDDENLVAALAGAGKRHEAQRFLAGFDAGETREKIAAAGVIPVCRHSLAYPPQLLELDDPPALLFTRGNATAALAALSSGPAVALVGSRKASPHAIEMARELGRGLAAAGITVVSGLALGVDASAHVGALEGQGAPVAVLGGGPDVIYPRANAALHERIVAKGLVVSELPPGQRPFRWSFPARNRIMAGLCRATVVVEAAVGSGSLITTDFAQDLGRTVGAVPGPALWERARGSNALLRSGAAVITSAEDVLDELYGIGVRPATAAGDGADCTRHDGHTDPGASMDGPEGAVLAAIESGAGIDGACEASGLPVAEVRALLARMEDSGRLCRDVLGSYVRRRS